MHAPWHGVQTPQASRDCCPAFGPDSAGRVQATPGPASHRHGEYPDSQLSSQKFLTTPNARLKRRKHYSIATLLFDRECRPLRCVAPRSFLQEFKSIAKTTYEINNANSGGSPPFSLQFGKTKRAATLAVADEDGYVSLINTAIAKDERANSHSYSWLCHRNAIFDVAFTEGDDILATASGDQTIRVWDLSAAHPAHQVTLRGHNSSVKAVKFRPGSQHEVVSGAREGNIFLWDTRKGCCETDPVRRILGAHVKDGFGGSYSSRGRRTGEHGAHHSVTSLVFLDDTVLASAGANDGTVKLWDLRKGFVKNGREVAIKSFMSRQASATGRPRGISSLALNSTKTKLLASSADHHLYLFDCILPEQEPVTFRGHVNNSFYVKSSFSPDDRFIVSGSSDYDVYIWDVSRPLIPPIRLKGHIGEVSDVDWCPADICKLASSSDDTTVRIWTIDRAGPARPDAADGHMYGSGVDAGVGRAEVPESWSTPSMQSAEDSLTCMETMVDFRTSWPGCPDAPSDHTGSMLRTPGGDGSGFGSADLLPQMRSLLGPGGGTPLSRSPSGSPTLRQARLDDMWKPVPRSARTAAAAAAAGECGGAGASAGGKGSGSGALQAKTGRAAAADDARMDLSAKLASPAKKRRRRSSQAVRGESKSLSAAGAAANNVGSSRK